MTERSLDVLILRLANADSSRLQSAREARGTRGGGPPTTGH